MVRVLRITNVVVIIGAVVLFLLPVVNGVRIAPEIRKRLKEPGATEKFTAAAGRPSKSEDLSSPLVKQAADLSNYLNPPPPPPPVTTSPSRAEPAPPAVVTPKFNLIGTSYYALRPDLSFALIDEPGNGLHWVREGNNVGHLKIEKIKEGSITINDGQRTSEMTVKVEELWRSLLKNGSSSSPSNTSDLSRTRQVQSPPSGHSIGPADITDQFKPTARPEIGNSPRPRPHMRNTPPPLPSPPSAQKPEPSQKPSVQENVEVEESPLVKEKQAQMEQLLNKLNSTKLTEAEEAKLNDDLFKLMEQIGDARATDQSAQPQPKPTHPQPAGIKK